MKLRKILITGALILSSISVSAQINKPSEFTKAEIDSTSYLMGVNFGSFIRSYNFTDVDYDKVDEAIDDFISAKGDPSPLNTEFLSQLRYNPNDMSEFFDEYLQKEEHTSLEIDKVSYLLGVNFGSMLRGYGFPKLDFGGILSGINDLLKANPEVDSEEEFNKQFKYSPSLLNDVFNRVVEKQQTILLETNIYEGEVFMANNAKAKGVKTTDSGLQYKIIKKGNKKHPDLDSDVALLYKGTLLDGTVFDETEGKNTRTLPLGNLIDAWQEGLPLIGEGGHIMLYVPYTLGYGKYGTGPIGPGAFLIFDIELVKVS
ncbi:MAG: FKBP-type peptidyl-prolyl cis-trans isomerase [Bacteroidales bacterium]|nr:FKBP-type peptidyl-prolyl cis-trans isomerase [Bacteroidales bacterium]